MVVHLIFFFALSLPQIFSFLSILVCNIVIDEVRHCKFFQLHGFTCGIDDLLLSQQSNETRRETLVESEECSKRIHMEFTQKTEVDLKGSWNDKQSICMQ